MGERRALGHGPKASQAELTGVRLLPVEHAELEASDEPGPALLAGAPRLARRALGPAQTRSA